jgi:hypothetical protein
MANSFYGSIDFSKLMELAKAGDKAFSKSEKNGKIYLNIEVYVKDEVGQYGDKASIRTSFKGATKEEKHYFSNLKESAPYVEPTVQASDFAEFEDLPF